LKKNKIDSIPIENNILSKNIKLKNNGQKLKKVNYTWISVTSSRKLTVTTKSKIFLFCHFHT